MSLIMLFLKHGGVMSTIINDYTDSNLFLTKYISSGIEILQKCKEVNDKVSELVEDEFAQFFLNVDPKISEWNKTIQNKKIKIVDSEKLGELKTIVTQLQTYQIQKISKVFMESVLTRIEDIQCAQQVLDLTTDSERAQAYLKRGIDYYNQEKYDKAIMACSQAIAFKEDLEKAFLYRKASLNALSSTERKKCLVAITTTTSNFQFCGLNDSDIDSITKTLMDKKGKPISLNLSCNFVTNKIAENLIDLAQKNPYVTHIEYERGKEINKTMRKLRSTLQENQYWLTGENEKRVNEEFFIAYREGKNQLQNDNIHQALLYFMQALNRNLHNPIGIESLISAMHKQQSTLARHEKAVTGIVPLSPSEFITGSLDGTLRKWGVDESSELFNWKQIKPQEITSVMLLNDDLIITGHSNGMIIIWDLFNTSPFQVIEKGH